MDVVSFSPTGGEYLLDASGLPKGTLLLPFPDLVLQRVAVNTTNKYATHCGKEGEPCVVESFRCIGNEFLAVLDQAVFLARKHNADLSPEALNMRD